MPDTFVAIEANELLFLEQHRSAVLDLGAGRLFVSSDRSVTSWNFIGSLKAPTEGWPSFLEIAAGFFDDWGMKPCLKLTPFSAAGLEPLLIASGWTVATRLTHMIHPSATIDPGSTDVQIRICTNSSDVRVFSEIQSAGFGDPSWFDWVHKVNVVNVPRSNQRFYVAYIGTRPVGVCLLLLSGDVAGLYAVATLESERGRGVARALVSRSAADARQLGATTLCLNTATGGDAQQAFRRLGFEDAFDSRFCVKESSGP